MNARDEGISFSESRAHGRKNYRVLDKEARRETLGGFEPEIMLRSLTFRHEPGLVVGLSGMAIAGDDIHL